MSIDAVITKVEDELFDAERGYHSRLILAGRVPGTGPGQPALYVLNPPPCGLKGLEGTKIWGDASAVMVGDVKIADRVGYSKIRLVHKR